MQPWNTAISTHRNGDILIRGKKLLDLIEQHSFVQALCLLLRNKLPNSQEEILLNAALVAMIEHGVEAPSAFVSRTAASTGNPVNAALAAGILTIGEYHGGAIEQCMRLLQSHTNATEVLDDITTQKQRMPGYGHKIYKDVDPRAQLLLKKTAESFTSSFVTLARDIEQELAVRTNKHLPINIDGAVAVILCQLGFDWRLGKAFFILGRLPGLMAHVTEEMVNEKPYRRLEEHDVHYTGPENA